MTLSESPPPAVSKAEEEQTMPALQNPVNIPDPQMKGTDPLEAVPLRMVLVPYGGKEPIPFDKNMLGHLRDQSVPIKQQSVRDGKQEVEIPQSLKSLKNYEEGDWKAFVNPRAYGCHKDWTYEHRLYRREFRSKPDVKEFLETNGPATGMFRGTKLQKKKIVGPGADGPAGKAKSTRGRKAANYATENVSLGPSRSIRPDMPHGFL
uniref:Uncharacterized protein n=1 Tax=Setaria italica TaxID=4555 RepID=K3ZJW0_SETIT